MKMIRIAIICGALLAAGGWYGAASPDRHFEAALRALRANDMENVQYQLLAVEARDDHQAQASLLRGWLLLQSPKRDDDPQRIYAILEELNDAATDDEADRALALALLARARYESGQLTDALVLLEQSWRLNKDEVETQRWAGIVMYELGLYMPAIPFLEEVARREPHNGRPHRLLAIIHRERGTIIGDAYALQAAIEAFQESLKRDPAQYDADEMRVELARCLTIRNEWDEALETLRPCFDSPDNLALRAECYYAKGQLDRATQCVDLALEQNPDDAYALSVKSTLALAKRDFRLAAELLERAVKEKPRDYNLRYRLVQAYRHLGDEELAAPHVEEMELLLKLTEEQKDLTRRALIDTDATLRYRLANLSAQLGDPQMEATWRKAAEMLDSPMVQRLMSSPPPAEQSAATENQSAGENPISN
jgi:tetratricopeptide (TPR) repeat protein